VTSKRWVILFSAALLFATAVAGWKGWLLWQPTQQQPDATISVGESITVQGSRYRVDQFAAGIEFDSQDSDEPTVRAPQGTKIILVTLTTEITDASVDPRTHHCSGELTDRRGRQWSTEYEVTSGIKRPAALGCTGTSERDIVVHQPLQVGFSYLVPAEVAGEVALELTLPGKDDYVIKVVR
jgi:hypothetical protein